jgi:hypothetical protein
MAPRGGPWPAKSSSAISSRRPASGSNAAPACRGGRKARVMSLAGHFVALSGGNYYGAKPTNTASVLSTFPWNATSKP